MARIGRVVAGGFPHHIVQRGNRRQRTFFEVWAYCLMPNYVHLIAVPESEADLCKAIGEAHRRYTRHINFREGWLEVIRHHERIGRPLGSEQFIEYLERKLNRPLRKGKPGPKKADSKN